MSAIVVAKLTLITASNPAQAGRLNHATAGLSASQAEVPDQVSGQRHAHRPPRANAAYAAASNNTALPPNAMAMSHGVKRPAPESVSNDTAQASLPSTQTQTGHVNELYDPITVAKAKHSTTSGDKQSSEYWALIKGRRQGVYHGRYYDVEQCFIFFNNDIKGFPTEAQARKHFRDRSNGKEAPATIYVKPDEEIISNEEFLSKGSRNLFRRLEEQRSTASDAAHIPTAPSVAQTTAASTSTIGTAPPSARLPTAASAASAPTTTGSAAATTSAAKAPTARATTATAPTATAPTATAPTATAPTATAPVTTAPTTTAPHVPDQRVHLPAQPSIEPTVSELVRNLQQSIPKSISSETKQQLIEQFVAGLA